MSAAAAEHGVLSLSIATDETPVMDLGPYRAGSVQFPLTMTSTSFTLLCGNDGALFSPPRDDAGALLGGAPCTGGTVVSLPAEAFNFRYCKLKLSDVEGAPRVVTVLLKS